MQKVWFHQAVSVGSLLARQIALCRHMGAELIPALGQRLTIERDGVGEIIERDLLAANIAMVERFCASLELEQSRLLAFELQDAIQHNPRRPAFSEIAGRLDALRGTILNEAFARLFLEVPRTLSRFVDQEKPLGDAVYNAFPSSRIDLTQAGNCLAFGCNNAAGFHLMLAAEIGLRELGRDRQIPSASAGQIEFSQWGKIIGELGPAVEAIKNWPNNRAKEDAHKFYNAALVEIRAFNDGWRRHMAHPRPHHPPMSDDEALALWGHVRRFLLTLAGKISEGNYTPLIW